MSFYHKLSKILSYKHFMENSVLMNWSPINKSLLVLILGALGHCLWILWYFVSLRVEQFNQWLNLALAPIHSLVLGLFLLGYFVLMYLCYHYRQHPKLKVALPYVAVFYFGVSFVHGGYYIGIMSPATIASYISLVTVGLVLFERKVVYSTIYPVTIFFIVAIYLTIQKQVRYAPLFSPQLLEYGLFQNTYWVYSMLYLYIPIFLISIILFEVLLTQWRHREKVIDQLSRLDALTGIYNRRSITETLNHAKTKQQEYALVLLDLDHFKQINDHYGHEVGDRVLKQVAKILSSNLRGEDIVGRFGGEEFMLVLLEDDRFQAIEIAERCRQQIEHAEIMFSGKRLVKVTASFGVAMSIGHSTKEDVIRLADEALYRAKADGRNCVRLAEECLTVNYAS